MLVNVTEKEGKIVIIPEGKIDSNTAPEFEKAVFDAVTDTSNVIADLEKLEFMSSAGLRVFLALQKLVSKNGSLKVKNVSDNIMEVFEITGFIDILDIE